MIRFSKLQAAAFALVLIACLSDAFPVLERGLKCTCVPGDECWPSVEEWIDFNRTVDGLLVSTVPLGEVCHDPTDNSTTCAALKEEWFLAPIHMNDSASVMSPVFQVNSCNPFKVQDTQCALGNLVPFSVNVSKVEHVQQAVKFAREKHIRLAIKNTGHDFLGRSTATAALGIWTHHLSSVQILNYTSSMYDGPAIKMDAGTQAAGAYQAASDHGYRTTGGTCPTVGVAGGFTQGGGHGPLSSMHGLGADNVLEWEIVTADSELVRASPTENSDLFWAVSGGGGGTFGVVVSMTAKVWPETPVTGAALTWNLTDSVDDYWESFGLFQAGTTSLVDSGSAAIVGVSNTTVTAWITAPQIDTPTLTDQLSYITTHLNESSIPYSLVVQTDPTYLDHFLRYYGPLPHGVWPTSHLIGSRLLPRKLFADETKVSSLLDLARSITTDNVWAISAVTLNANLSVAGIESSYNSVPSAWRDTLVDFTVYSTWDYTLPQDVLSSRSSYLTTEIDPTLADLTPGSATYANEGNWNQTDWQEAFFGSSWDRLSEVKSEWDPKGVFYARVSVGSEKWIEDEGNGRLCKIE